MIRLYYHIYTSTHRNLCLSFIDQQLRRIFVSNIHKYAQLNCTIHGFHWEDALDLVNRYGHFRILDARPDDPGGLRETKTLRFLWLETQPDDAVFFMHTKGIAYASGEKSVAGLTLPRNLRAINSWRQAMEHYNLDRWVERFNKFRMNQTEVQGVFLNTYPYFNYVGNFWWSSGAHIRRLCDPTTMEGVTKADAARMWLFWHMPNFNCDFHVLDKPREDGRYVYGAFRMHEDDCFRYMVEDQEKIPSPLPPELLI
ncbi:hypothetical protein EBU71_11565 [bacterium]|nr:hypothetical protein [Candidatus Elulimicrobium humile]